MAAVTGIVIAAAGIGLSVAQAVKQDKLKKQASKAAERAANQLKNIQQKNPYDSVGVPTMGTKLAQEGIDRSSMAALQSLQGAGAEGVLGGVPALTSSVNEAELGLSAEQNQLEYERDLRRAEAQRLVDSENADRREIALTNELQGAQMASAEAEANKQAAIGSAVKGAGSMITSLGGIEKLDYGWAKKGSGDNSGTGELPISDQEKGALNTYYKLKNKPV